MSNKVDLCTSCGCSLTPGEPLQGPPGPPGPPGPDGTGTSQFHFTSDASSPTTSIPLYTHRNGDNKTHIHLEVSESPTLSVKLWWGVDKTDNDSNTYTNNGWVYTNDFNLA